MNNKKKNEKYADLMDKLKKSINNGFYYESIFIEYAIFEDRTESLLKHAKYKIRDNDDMSFTLSVKINKIINNSRFHDNYIRKHLSNELLNNIDFWRKKRNKLIHDLINCSYNNEQIKKIAIEGYELVKKLNNKSTLVNNYFDKMNL